MSGHGRPPFNFDEDIENEDLDEEIVCNHLPNPQAIESPDNPDGIGALYTVIAAGVAGTAGVAAPVLGTAALTGVGFTSSGVAAGSIAAGLQAATGNVAAGSLFAACQSVGATGGFALLGPLGIGAAAVGGLGYLGGRALRSRRTNRNQELNAEIQPENNNINPGNVAIVRPMCQDCRGRLLLIITQKFFRHRI